MTFRIELLPSAWEDLKNVEDWYLLNFNVETALKVSDHILDSLERLGQHPDLGTLTPDSWLNQRGYRMVICKQHVAIYRQIDEIIYVYHIADTRRDYAKLFYHYEIT